MGDDVLAKRTKASSEVIGRLVTSASYSKVEVRESDLQEYIWLKQNSLTELLASCTPLSFPLIPGWE